MEVYEDITRREEPQNIGEGKTKLAHSVKVPKLYKVASQVLKKVETYEDGLRNAIFAAKHPNKKAVTALVSTALQKAEEINYAIKKAKLVEKEPRLESQLPLIKILVVELIRGKLVNNQRQAKPILTVLSAKDQLEKALNKFARKTTNRKNEPVAVEKPRYVRVNTLKLSVQEAVKYLIDEGWCEKPFEEVNNLSSSDFAKDDTVDNLLIFAPRQDFHTHPLYLDGSFVLQDKASCLAAMALKPRKGRCVLDACAAPGMKTSYLASLAGSDSEIFAVEKSTKRCNTLREMLHQLGCDFVSVLNEDFTEIDPSSYPNIEYILVDPSCSGSGMSSRVDIPQYEENLHDRLKNLSHYQQKVLCHALRFPGVKRIVYSTCSVNSLENEDVIQGALSFEDNHKKFRLKKALPLWKHRLQNHRYEWAELCAKCDLENDKTDGFFIAVIEKIR